MPCIARLTRGVQTGTVNYLPVPRPDMIHGKGLMIALCGILLAGILLAGCTGTTSTAGAQGTPVPTTGSVAAPGTVVVKNMGADEIHAWIATDQTTWAGSSANRIGPNGQLTIPYTASPVLVCIGKSEKILTCTSLVPSSSTLVWDGNALSTSP